MTDQHLQHIRQDAESNLHGLMDILNHAPHLAEQIKPLVTAHDFLPAVKRLIESKPDIAEQLLRLSLATLVNYHTTIEIGKRTSAVSRTTEQ